MGLTKIEEEIFQRITVPSDDDPERPEFPPDHPRFPATPVVRIHVPGFSDVWLKDESINPTGTHKDRMAWELVVTYKHFLWTKRNGVHSAALPKLSIISSGSAAFAIQSLFKKYGLPNLKTLVDTNISNKIYHHLNRIGCEIYRADLSKKALDWKDILRLTKNPSGLDVTSGDALDATTRFYDWMSYEIIDESPDYCFVPFGTGNLFENLLNINKKEVSTRHHHDPRFRGNIGVLRQCNFFGATTNDPYTKADKLYSPHLPFAHFNSQWIRLYRYAGYCGQKSDVLVFKESALEQAMDIARDNNITCEPSGIVGLALMLQLKSKLPRDKKMLIVNTGKCRLEE